MAPEDTKPEIPRGVPEHVEHVLTRLMTPDELDSWELRWERDGRRWRLVVEVMARGEAYLGFITDYDADYPTWQGLDTFTDGLEDFISESRFAWGQRRELKERPWRAQSW